MNCKIGDIAIIIGGQVPSVIGGLVRVLRWCNAMHEWEIEPLSHSVVARMAALYEIFPDARGLTPCIWDRHLKPVSGIPDELAINDAEPVAV